MDDNLIGNILGGLINRDNDGFQNGGWWIILLMIFFWGGNGFGGWGNRGMQPPMPPQNVVTANTANTQKILDRLCQMESNAKDNTIAQLRTDLQAAQLTLGNNAQTQALIGALKPYPQPAYVVSSPYATNYGGTTIL